MLGDGHRTYPPVLRYFMTEDPILEGYTFGSNTSIMNIDSSGNMSKKTAKKLIFAAFFCLPPLNFILGTTVIESEKHPHNKALAKATKELLITTAVGMFATEIFTPVNLATLPMRLTGVMATLSLVFYTTIMFVAHASETSQGASATRSQNPKHVMLQYISSGSSSHSEGTSLYPGPKCPGRLTSTLKTQPFK